MIEAILPAGVAVAETGEDEEVAALFPEEEALVARAVEKRRREFAGGRACARRALATLGFPPGPIGAGERGEPIWPSGAVGSITHCRGYRGAAVARAEEMTSVGIDAEPGEPLPEGLAAEIARPEELAALAALERAEPGVSWDRLLFSAKEAAYKAWYPLAGRWLGLLDTTVELDPGGNRFLARLPEPRPRAGTSAPGPQALEGRWLLVDGLVLTAVAVSR